MHVIRNLIVAFTVLLASTTTFAATLENVAADDKEVVQALYDFLSNPGSETHANAFLATVADDWSSVSDYSGMAESKEEFVTQLKGFAKLIPNLNWAVEEVLQDGNRVIVRGRGTGTPNGPLFGVDGQGNSFELLSIDIHTVEQGKIIQTYHVEDWAGALRQLSAQ